MIGILILIIIFGSASYFVYWFNKYLEYSGCLHEIKYKEETEYLHKEIISKRLVSGTCVKCGYYIDYNIEFKQENK